MSGSLEPAELDGTEPVLLPGELRVMQQIEHVTAQCNDKGKEEQLLFAGAHLTVVQTNLRLVLVLPSRPKSLGLALHLSKVSEVKDSTKGGGLFFSRPKLAVKFKCSATERVVLYFSHPVVKDEFLTKAQSAHQAKSWQQQQQQQQQQSSHTAETPAAGLASAPVGIAGLQRHQQEQLKKSAEITQDASRDLEHLMTHAKEVVQIVGQYARLLQQPAGSSVGSNGAADSQVLQDEAKEMEAILQSIGMVSPVTKLSAGRMYHQELANQLAALLQAEGRLARLGGMISLTYAYCLFNRARGMELVSPDDLFTAASLMQASQHAMQLRRFDSGVLVIQAAALNDVGITRRLVDLCSQGKLATEIATALGVSLLLCKEQLAMAEKRGALCRDESVAGVRWFPNIFFC